MNDRAGREAPPDSTAAVPVPASFETAPNPVVRGLSPDPSACRVGGDYFLATSTLEFWPGIPIRHSTDLVHWTVIGHAVTRPAQYRRDRRLGPLRLYAPTLRHHSGRFYLTCTNVAPGQGNFLLTADDPAGPWSDATWIDADAFDPSLNFDGESVLYTRRTVVAGKEGSGPVVQAELDVDSGNLLTPTVPITPHEAGYCSNDIEGPHIYRIGQWWYLLAAEGGTWKGHMVTVARATSPWGPFVGYEHNPVLTHRHRVGHPIQSTGHAELVDDVKGNWWALFLGTRHHGPKPWHHLGREVFLAPVTWSEDGWPQIGERGTVELEHQLRQPLPAPRGEWPKQHTPWTSGWCTREAPLDGLDINAASPEDMRIALPASPRTLSQDGPVAAAFLSQQEPTATFHATLDALPAYPAHAGIAVYASSGHYYLLTAHTGRDGSWLRLTRQVGDMRQVTSMPAPASAGLEMRISGTLDRYSFHVRTADADAEQAWLEVGSGQTSLLSAETSQSYSGARFCVYANGAATSFRRVGSTNCR